MRLSSNTDHEKSREKQAATMSSDPYEGVKGGRLTFKGGSLATRSKGIDKKKKKKKAVSESQPPPFAEDAESGGGGGGGEEIYTIDAAKKMKYEDLFPVEAKKFGYSMEEEKKTIYKSVEDALDDRVKKKADRYCK